MTFDLFGNAISSPGLGSGRSQPAAPISPTTRPYGLDPALASLSARQAKEKGLLTSGTSGPPSTISSSNARLRSSLASRLREQTAMLGSTLYRLTWTQRVMPSGLRKPALRVSARRTRDPAITGWPTASARDWKDTPGMAATGTNPDGSDRSRLDQLPRVAYLAGWPTSRAADGEKNVRTLEGSLSEIARKGGPQDLSMGAALAGWATPMAGSPGTTTYSAAGNTDSSRQTVALCGGQIAGHNLNLPDEWSGPARLTDSGEMLTGSDAATKSGGQLSPAHSLWLMLGPFATAWASCGERVTLARSGRRKASSKP
jgi:hypothetical protein